MKVRDFKSIFTVVKNELSPLMDFEHANMYLFDPSGNNLLAISARENEQLGSMEQDYVVDPEHMVQFSAENGVNGMAF